MIKNIKVRSPKRLSTGIDGGHSYLAGKTDWEGKETAIFVFLVDKKEEAKLENADFDGIFTCDAERHDFVKGFGLSLHNGKIIGTEPVV